MAWLEDARWPSWHAWQLVLAVGRGILVLLHVASYPTEGETSFLIQWCQYRVPGERAPVREHASDLCLHHVCTYPVLFLLSHSAVSASFPTPWTLACQALLSVGFPRQEYWSGLPLTSPGDLPNPGTEPISLALADRFFTSEPTGKTLHASYKPKQIIGPSPGSVQRGIHKSG